MATSVKLTDVNRYISRNYGSLNKARKALGIKSAALTRAKVAQMIGEQQKKRYQNLQKSLIVKAQRSAKQASLKARQGLQRKAYDQRKAITEKVISDLEASGKRIAASERSKAAKKRGLILGSLQATDTGGRITRTLTAAQLKKTLSVVPLSPEVKDALRAQITSLKPSKIATTNNKYGLVTIQGLTYYPQSQREKNYLSKLKGSIARDEKLKQDYNNALTNSGLVVSRGDKWYIKGFKGVGAAGIGLLFTGAFLANAGDKLAFSIASIGASKRARQAVGQESVRAAKLTPKTTLQSIDPTKPENWANILLLGLATAEVAAVKAAGAAKLKALEKSEKTITKAARSAAKKDSVIAKNLKGLASDIKVLIKRNKLVADLLKDIKKIRLVKDKQLKIKRANVLKKVLEKEKKAQLRLIKNARLKRIITRKFNDLLKKVDFTKPVRKTVAKAAAKVKETIKSSELFKDVAKDINKIKRLKTEAARTSAARRQLRILERQYKSSLKRARNARIKARITNRYNLVKKKLYDIVPFKKLSKKIKAELKTAKGQARRLKMTAERKARIRAYQKSLEKKQRAFKKSYDLRVKRFKQQAIKRYFKRLVNPLLDKFNNLITRVRANIRKRYYDVVDLDKIRQQQLNIESRLNGALKQKTINLRQRFAKESSKLEKGLQVKAARSLSKSDRLAIKRSQRTSVKDVSRAQRSLKWVVSKDIRIGKFAKGVVVDLVERNGRLTAVVVSDKGGLVVVKKTGNNLKPVAKVNAKTTSKGFEVNTGNGQVVLLQEAKTVTKKPVTKTATRTVVKVKPGTVAKAKAYYALLLKQASKGTTTSKAKSIGSLGNVFFPLFLGGKISKSIVAGISGVKSLPKSVSKISGRQSSKQKAIVKAKVTAAEKVIGRLASKLAGKVSPKIAQSLLQRYISLRKSLPKGFKLKLPKRKKPSKSQKKYFDELYSKLDKKYKPSLAAILFGIYGYRPKVITGLEIRPLIKNKRGTTKR